MCAPSGTTRALLRAIYRGRRGEVVCVHVGRGVLSRCGALWRVTVARSISRRHATERAAALRPRRRSMARRGVARAVGVFLRRLRLRPSWCGDNDGSYGDPGRGKVEPHFSAEMLWYRKEAPHIGGISRPLPPLHSSVATTTRTTRSRSVSLFRATCRIFPSFTVTTTASAAFACVWRRASPTPWGAAAMATNQRQETKPNQNKTKPNQTKTKPK